MQNRIETADYYGADKPWRDRSAPACSACGLHPTTDVAPVPQLACDCRTVTGKHLKEARRKWAMTAYFQQR